MISRRVSCALLAALAMGASHAGAVSNFGAQQSMDSHAEKFTQQLKTQPQSPAGGFQLISEVDLCDYGNCDTCKVNADCPVDETCQMRSGMKFCRRRPLFPEFDWKDGLATIASFFGAALAAGGGLGGGGLFVPIFILVVGLKTEEAIPLSQAMIFGGSIANLILNAGVSHPDDPARSVIDFQTLLVLQPTMLIGTILGVFFHVMSPHWFLLLLLAITLSYSVYKTYQRAVKAWNEENAARYGVNPSQMSRESSRLDLLEEESIESASLIAPSDEDLKLYEGVKQREQSSKWPIFFVVLLWTVVAAFTLVRGGHPIRPSLAGVVICSATFWVLTLIQIPLLGGFVYVPAKTLGEDYAIKVRLGRDKERGQIQWTKFHLWAFPFLSLAAGILGGMLGLGGGMFMGPILLQLGMLPQVAAATSATTVLISSSAAALNFYVIGMLLEDYAGWYMAIGFIATIFGSTLVSYLIKKYNRTSIIIIVIVVLIAIATLLLLVVGGIQLSKDLKTGEHLAFTGYCPNRPAPTGAPAGK